MDMYINTYLQSTCCVYCCINSSDHHACTYAFICIHTHAHMKIGLCMYIHTLCHVFVGLYWVLNAHVCIQKTLTIY